MLVNSVVGGRGERDEGKAASRRLYTALSTLSDGQKTNRSFEKKKETALSGLLGPGAGVNKVVGRIKI